MDEIKWRFPINDSGGIRGINDTGVAMFRGNPLSSLAREICQNSLDAAISDKEPVKVQFKMFTIKTDEIYGMKDLKETFLKCKDFWGDQVNGETVKFFNNAITVSNRPECRIMRISDFNTTGLLGSEAKINTDWTNLTKSTGVSDKKGTAGGSFGIGKFAPFACSDFFTVFYSTKDCENKCAYQG